MAQAWRSHVDEITTTKAQWIAFGFRYILQFPPRRSVALSHPVSDPSGDQIPFSSFMKIPVPFLESNAKDFTCCHLPKMTNPTFLIGDEWVGYYSYGSNIMNLDPPMRGIIFERDHTASVSAPGLMPLWARGIDNVGDFTLEGEIDCRRGSFTFVKQYTHGHRWQWSGMMTPFGMAGKWYGASYSQWGWFWLWKANWTRGCS